MASLTSAPIAPAGDLPQPITPGPSTAHRPSESSESSLSSTSTAPSDATPVVPDEEPTLATDPTADPTKDFVQEIMARNSSWADRMHTANPALFARNAKGQAPHVLWIGCSDSRVGEFCIDLLPGSVFVHRNIANLMPYGDLSSLSVVQFAVDTLKVRHIVVCGHYDCGGAAAALGNKSLGVLDHWLKHLRDVRAQHKDELAAIQDPKARLNRLVELNVVAQVHHVRRMAPVVEALKQGRIAVYGMVYDVSSGHIKPIEVPHDDNEMDYLVYSNDEDFEH